MFRLLLAVEDKGHKNTVTSLIGRVFDHSTALISVESVSLKKTFVLKHIAGYGMPDSIIVCRDANCNKYVETRNKLEEEFGFISTDLVYAIPDPHIEKWLLTDSEAFKAALGKGCDLPAKKCNKDEYKHLLGQAVSNAGLTPVFHGLEHAESIISHMNLSVAEKNDKSLSIFIRELRALKNRLENKANLN